MASKTYLCVTNLFQNINESYEFDEEPHEIFDFFTYHILNQFIYNNSRINISDFYKSCCMISYKTSNNQSEIEKMPFYVFNNFNIYLTEIIEAENKGSGGSKENAEGEFANMQQQAKSNMKSMQSSFKMPSGKLKY
jgi:hypothetical protein